MQELFFHLLEYLYSYLTKTESFHLILKDCYFLLFAVISAVGYNLTLSRLVGTYSPVYIVNVQNIIGAILFLPLFLILDFNHFINTPFTFKMFIPIIAACSFCLVRCIYTFCLFCQKYGNIKSKCFFKLHPVFTALFSFILLGEKLTFQNITGMIIVIAGLFMSQMNGRKRIIDEALTLR